MSRLPAVATLLSVLLLAAPSAAHAAAKQPRIYTPRTQPGEQTLTYRFGPIHVVPGQNTIDIAANDQRPQVPGFITRFQPDLVYADGTKVRRNADGSVAVPRVDVIHLHHGVWISNGKPLFAAGEEKTERILPAGFGLAYKPEDKWLMNYMVHNLTPNPDSVFVQYTVGFIPASAPEAKTIEPLISQPMDAVGGIYPVFDALRKDGDAHGEYTFPDDAKDPYAGGPARNRWVVDKDRTIVQTGGHLHPGGKETFLTITRGGRTRRIFTSKAYYWEPAGAVSWDVAMTVSPPNWRVAVKQGDVIEVHGTYDVSRASWYESMAIQGMALTERPIGGKDPFRENTDVPG